MSRTPNKTIGALAAVVAIAALVPAAGAANPTGSAQGIGPSGLGDRTATELGQAVGEPGEERSAAVFSRTPTELAQRVAPSDSPEVTSSGFDWGDAAIGAGTVVALGLTAFGGMILVDRRRPGGSSGLPAASS